ncbi:tetratricopeptide repeat protein [Rhizobium jaguaris]|uniref:Tetratricopeptide repeat protein n=1 Tax=Rhizobium jaguaris TaxID=1312183 RepID=A0A387GAH3_9HYPH|nr:hypothetical protein [Rhizobium jaguaris]AYG64346.1 hypothetical protein CCGE525_36960 [Rhizobium jaguaris]
MDGKIELEIFEDGGVFRHGDDYDGIVEELDNALDQRDAGTITPAKYLKTLKALVERHPLFIDGHAHLGNALMEEGKPKLALQACLRGLAAGERAIPAEFSGQIEWSFLENRPFLRAAHGAVLSQLRLGQRHDALRLMEKMLAWNPNDNQGIRCLIGSEYLRAGETKKAERIFTDEAGHYPPYHYEHALLRLKSGDPLSAATSLRRGFVANGYIAEILSGNPEPMPLAIWHGSNLAEPETARDYLDHCGDLWQRTPGAIAFVRWLHTHPKILIERAVILDCQEALLWEFDPARRRDILDREDAALGLIDDALSHEIIQCRTDRHGRQIEPWRYRPARF